VWIIFHQCWTTFESSVLLVGHHTVHKVIKRFLQHLIIFGYCFSQLKKIISHTMLFETRHSEVSMNITEMCLHEEVQHVDWNRYGNDSAPMWLGSHQAQFAWYHCTVAFVHGIESLETFWTE
jgi:hypothetical protein